MSVLKFVVSGEGDIVCVVSNCYARNFWVVNWDISFINRG